MRSTCVGPSAELYIHLHSADVCSLKQRGGVLSVRVSRGDHCSVIVSSDATAGKTLTDVHGVKEKLRKVSISSR